MPNNQIINTSGIVGTDGITPIYDPQGIWKMWRLLDIYRGGPGAQRYVPNVGDFVLDTDLVVYYSVLSINASTLIPTLSEKTPVADVAVDGDDILLGVGPGTQSDTYRVYLDKTVTPYTLAVDARLRIAGSMASSCKIFKGTDLSDPSKIISAFYDNSGTLLGTSIPLELVSIATTTNYAIKTVATAYTMQNLLDGEIVTAVFYSDTGHVVSKRQLLVENTAFIRQATLGSKYITGISLECPFLSNVNPRLINLPINVMLDGLNLIGVVHYSDGSISKMAVDGNKFSVLGISSFIATVVGQQIPIVLKYQLGIGETVYGMNTGQSNFITETYQIQTANVDGSYDVKLFGYPVWIDSVNGYTLNWFLYTGDRDVLYNVTGLVEWNVNSPAFNPIAYGVTQHLTVAINLKAANSIYNNYRHVQIIDIVLLNQGTERTTNWTIGFETGQTPQYGVNNHAALTFVNSNLYKLRVDLGAADQTEWLNRLYYTTKPLYDPRKETAPLVPTHFRVLVGNLSPYVLPITQWNQEISIGSGLVNSGTVFIQFIRRNSNTDLELSVAGVSLYQTN